MSRNEWASGTIVLPSAEFAGFRQAMQNVTQYTQQAIFDLTQKFWQGLTAKERRDTDAYEKALRAWSQRERVADERIVDEAYWRLSQHPCKRVLKSELVWPTARTVKFGDGEPAVIFNREKRTVHYGVQQNNHAREHARESPLGRAFDEHIAKVRWAHGTGGVILGNDEYNEESGENYIGGGGSYVVAAYGYLGAKEAPTDVGVFLNSKGERVCVEVKWTRTGAKGKVIPAPNPVYTRPFSSTPWRY